MFKKSQEIVSFLDGKIKLALKVNDLFYNLQGIQISIPLQKIIESIQNNFADSNSLDVYEQKLNSDVALVDIDLLWQKFIAKASEPQKLTEFLSSRYDVISPIYMAMKNNFVYFEHKNDLFICRSKEIVEGIKKSQEKRQEKKAFYDSLARILLHEDLASYKSPFFNEFLKEVETAFYAQNKIVCLKLLEEINPWGLPIFWAAFTLLQKTGRIAKDKRFFLESNQLLDGYSNQLVDMNLIDYKEDIITFNEPIVTIDDEETRDMDDALSIKKTSNGYQVTVFITDVSAYIKEDSFLDKEARQRGSSIYMADGFVNMFPDKLVYEKLALRQRELCPVVAYEIKFSNDGKQLSSRIYCCQVKITHRLSFEQVDEFLAVEPVDDLSQMCYHLLELAKIFSRWRYEAGAIDIGKPHLKIRLCKDEVVLKKVCRKSPTYFLVGELMVLANTIAANYCVENDLPCLYKKQVVKKDKKLIMSADYDPIIFRQITKQIKRVSMGVEPGAYEGLGVNLYTQITSPIRRYSDLIIQRQITQHLRYGQRCYSNDALLLVHQKIKQKVSIVNKVQNLSDQYYFLRWLSDNRRSYKGVVILKNEQSYKVELSDLFYAVSIISKNSLAIGEQVEVFITNVNPYNFQVDTELLISS